MKKQKVALGPDQPILNLKKNTIYLCHDCEKDVLVRGISDTEDIEVQGGKLCFYQTSKELVGIIKCDECYEKNQSLAHFQDCEVYARVVGYIRPVQQWHPGKQEEYHERVNYKIKE